MNTPFDIVIVGGSVAATRAAEAAVRHAPQLTVLVVSDEPHAPYERPPLSKTPLDDPVDLAKLTYRTVETLVASGVQFQLNTRAEGLDLASRTVRTTAGDVAYRSLVIATGCDPIFPALFAGREDVFVLRRYEDAVALRAAVADPGRAIAIVGAGFIGGEFAATLSKQGRQISLIDLAFRPLGRFGEEIADAYEDLHRDAGINLQLGRAAVDVTEESGRRKLVLDDGSRVAADVILLGVGVRPAVEWLADSGLPIENGIICDAHLRASDGVFAAGDAVHWLNGRYDDRMRIEHWTTAAEQGRTAGINAANAVLNQPLVACSTVPYFWSDQHGVRMQFAGRRTGDEETVETRDDKGALFLFRRGDDVTGVFAFERRQDFVKIRAALRQPLLWSKAQELVGLA